MAATGAVFAFAGSAAAASGPTVEPNGLVNLDSAPTRTHDAPSLAVSPKNSNLVVMGEVDLQHGRCLTHVSHDGGHTWSDAGSPQNSDFVNCGPQNGNNFNTGTRTALTFARDGTLYYAFAAARASDGDSRSILLGKSTDSGMTYTTTVVYQATASPDPNKPDVNYLPTVAVDPDNAKRVYVAFARTYNFALNKVDNGFVAASDDGGATFGTPVDVGVAAREVSLAVTKGNVLAIFAESTPFPPPGPAKFFASISKDHGKSFNPKVITVGAKRVSTPKAAVDPTNGTVVIAWYDNHLAKAGAVQDDVFAKASSDGGNSWGKTVRISPSHAGMGQNVNQLFPAISGASSGRIDVVWYDYRNDPFPIPSGARASYLGSVADLYAASSTDDGKTFTSAVRVTDHPIDRRIGTWNGQYFYVIPPAVASTNQTFVAAWSDTRNGNPDTQAQDIYAAKVEVPAAPLAGSASNGPDLRALLLGLELLVVGAGIALLVAALVVRRRIPRATPSPVEQTTPAPTRSR
jgi:hypothetical protein